MSQHFTAVIKVTKVTEAFTETKQNGYNNEKIEHPREVKDVTEVVIRSDTLVKMKERLAAHIELVEEY